MKKAIEGIEKKIKEYKRLLKNNKPLDYGEGVVEGLEEALELVKNNGVFDDVIKWLVMLDGRYGVDVESSVFEVKQEPGRVDARLVFEAAT